MSKYREGMGLEKEDLMPSSSITLRTEKKGPVTTVILNRPEVRNAVDRSTAKALADAFRLFEKDREAKVAVFFGEHGTFCAGADLKAIASRDHASRLPKQFKGDGPMGPTCMVLSKPVIAAIAGYAVAGGLELALWCDLRVMEEDAILGVFCRRWGVPLTYVRYSPTSHWMRSAAPVSCRCHRKCLLNYANGTVPTATERLTRRRRHMAASPPPPLLRHAGANGRSTGNFRGDCDRLLMAGLPTVESERERFDRRRSEYDPVLTVTVLRTSH